MAASSQSSKLLAVGGVVFALGVVLVLFLVRGGDDGPSAAPQPTVTPSDTASPTDTATDATLEVPAGVSTRVEIPVDLVVPDGTEAVAIDVNYLRSTAALPALGDLVRLYWLPNITERENLLLPLDRNGDGQPDLGPDGRPQFTYAGPLPEAEPLGLDLEVLAVIGAHPVARGGSSTMVVGVPSARVPEVLAMISANELWVTLLPSTEG